MKTRYSRIGNQGLLTPGRALFGVVVVAIVALFVLRTFFPDTLIALARPLQLGGDALTAAVGSFEGEGSVKEERDKLAAEVEKLRSENEVLRAQITDLGPVTGEGIRAGVIARPPTSPYDTLVVSAGTRDGVTLGAIAYGDGGVPLGPVARVSERTAHILLYSAPGRTTEGWAGPERIPVSIVGAGSGAYRASVAKDAPLKVDDQVFAPGPGALPIGVVARIDTDASSPSATVFIRPLVNPFTTTWVSIALP